MLLYKKGCSDASAACILYEICISNKRSDLKNNTEMKCQQRELLENKKEKISIKRVRRKMKYRFKIYKNQNCLKQIV